MPNNRVVGRLRVRLGSCDSDAFMGERSTECLRKLLNIFRMHSLQFGLILV